MRKIILYTATVLVVGVLCTLFYSNYQKKKYVKYTKEAVTQMVGVSAVSEKACEFYQVIWRNAIYKEGSYYAGGKYNGKDFNEALVIAKEDIKDEIKNLNRDMEKTTNTMKKLNNPPMKYHELHDRLVILYSFTKEFNQLANSPTGSLMSFSQKVNELESGISKKVDEITIQLPE